MNENQKIDELKELLSGFMDTEEAAKAADEIRTGEQILADNPAPQPGSELLRDIKAAVDKKLASKLNLVQLAYSTAVAAAAAVIILAVINTHLFKKDRLKLAGENDTPRLSAAVWESDDIAAGDEQLAILADEVGELAGEIIALQVGDNGDNGTIDLSELEIEFAEINGDFWKG